MAAPSLAIMPVLSYAQRRAGRGLGSRSAVADSKQTAAVTVKEGREVWRGDACCAPATTVPAVISPSAAVDDCCAGKE